MTSIGFTRRDSGPRERNNLQGENQDLENKDTIRRESGPPDKH